MSVPMGFTGPMDEDIRAEADKEIKLPAGLQIVGKMWDEATVLVIGDALEGHTPWKSLTF